VVTYGGNKDWGPFDQPASPRKSVRKTNGPEQGVHPNIEQRDEMAQDQLDSEVPTKLCCGERPFWGSKKMEAKPQARGEGERERVLNQGEATIKFPRGQPRVLCLMLVDVGGR